MARSTVSKGICSYCGVLLAKTGMTRHLAACPARQTAIQQADGGKLPRETLYHLRVEAEGSPTFWLDLEMRGSATLNDLDRYLRAIWLECCGHMSKFSLGGWGRGEIAQSRRADQIFTRDRVLTHIYDFGTSSITHIKAVGVREGKPTTRHPIALLARNQMPDARCSECGEPATQLCLECLNDHADWNTLCDKHAESHPHDNYGEPIPLVNSPRLGLCGYSGPADPPY